MGWLVTGAAGYLGQHVTSTLTAHGEKFTPYGWDTPKSRDLTDIESLYDALTECEGVIHCAAYKHAGESVRTPGETWWNNVAGTVTLLEAMRQADVKRLVFTSSAAVYGDPGSTPVPETVTGTPLSPYGWSKLIGEWAAEDYTAYGFGVVALRCFNLVGSSLPDVEDASPYSLHGATKTRAIVNGTDYPTPDGSTIRDYVHVQDVAEAHYLATLLTGQPGFTVLNIGTGRGTSTIQRLAGRDWKPGARRPGDPAVIVADSRKANELMGWVPTECVS